MVNLQNYRPVFKGKVGSGLLRVLKTLSSRVRTSLTRKHMHQQTSFASFFFTRGSEYANKVSIDPSISLTLNVRISSFPQFSSIEEKALLSNASAYDIMDQNFQMEFAEVTYAHIYNFAYLRSSVWHAWLPTSWFPTPHQPIPLADFVKAK